MNYADNLINTINTLGNIDKTFETYEDSLDNISFENLIKLNESIENELLKSKLMIISENQHKSFFDLFNYFMNNRDIFNRIMENEDLYLETFLNTLNILKPNDFVKFNYKVIDKVLNENNNRSYYSRFDDSDLRTIFIHCINRNLINDDNVLRIFKLSIKLKSIVSISSNQKRFLEMVDFAFNNCLDCFTYDIIADAFGNELNITNDTVKEYLMFLYENDIETQNLEIVLNNNNLEKRKECYIAIRDIFENDLKSYSHLIEVFEHFSFNLKELSTFLYKIKNDGLNDELKNKITEINIETSREHLLDFIYPNYSNAIKAFFDDDNAIDLVHYALQNNKKKFIQTLSTIEEMSLKYTYFLNDRDVYEVVNLNLLTKEQIEYLSGYNIPRGLSSRYRKNGLKNISFNELTTIMELSIEQSKLYSELINLKPDDRLRIIKDIPRDFKVNLEDSELASLLAEKSLSQRINELSKTIDKVPGFKVSKSGWLKYITLTDIDHIKSQAKKETDVKFIINHHKELLEVGECDFELTKKDIFFNSEIYATFIKNADLSDSFILDNQESLYNFYISGLMRIFTKYYNSIRSSYRSNLVNITKAHLSNKLSDIKFFKDDLKKEISFDISKDKEEMWKDNARNTSSKYITEEAYDYESIIKLGKIPVSTCMSYDGGSYNYCLLSNFDANKKVILVKNASTEEVVARAIFRLTKISSDNTITENIDLEYLSFRDVENLSNEEKVKNTDKTEELVLFLEKCYTDSNDTKEVKNELIKLAYKKAKILGVRLVISREYNEDYKCIKELPEKLVIKSNGYMFISKSKNGIQYLDSFGGSNTNNDSRYISCKNYLTLLQDGMFNPALDKEKE